MPRSRSSGRWSFRPACREVGRPPAAPSRSGVTIILQPAIPPSAALFPGSTNVREPLPGLWRRATIGRRLLLATGGDLERADADPRPSRWPATFASRGRGRSRSPLRSPPLRFSSRSIPSWLVAAAYPFVLLASAWELDRLAPRPRALVGLLIVLAQVPWLISYTLRIWPLPLRSVEIALIGLTLAAIVLGLTRDRARAAVADLTKAWIRPCTRRPRTLSRRRTRVNPRTGAVVHRVLGRPLALRSRFLGILNGHT